MQSSVRISNWLHENLTSVSPGNQGLYLRDFIPLGRSLEAKGFVPRPECLGNFADFRGASWNAME